MKWKYSEGLFLLSELWTIDNENELSLRLILFSILSPSFKVDYLDKERDYDYLSVVSSSSSIAVRSFFSFNCFKKSYFGFYLYNLIYSSVAGATKIFF